MKKIFMFIIMLLLLVSSVFANTLLQSQATNLFKENKKTQNIIEETSTNEEITTKKTNDAEKNIEEIILNSKEYYSELLNKDRNFNLPKYVDTSDSFNKNKNLIIVDLDGTGDFTSIQDALNAAESGDTVLIRKDVYEIEEPLLLEDKDNIVITGEDNQEATLILTESSEPVNSDIMLYLDSVENITVKNLKFVKNYEDLTIDTYGIFVTALSDMESSKSLYFDNLYFDNFKFGISLNGPYIPGDIVVNNSEFINTDMPFGRTSTLFSLMVNATFSNNYVYRDKTFFIEEPEVFPGILVECTFGLGLGSVHNLNVENNEFVSDITDTNGLDVVQSSLFMSSTYSSPLKVHFTNNLFNIPNSRNNREDLSNINYVDMHDYYFENNTFAGDQDILLYVSANEVDINKNHYADSLNVGDIEFGFMQSFGVNSITITNSELTGNAFNDFEPIESLTLSHNYYENYNGEDVDGDGLGDTPKEIYGVNDNLLAVDSEPRMDFGYCSDNTFAGECSSEEPSYCTYNLEIVDDCFMCGCPTQHQCRSDGSCEHFSFENNFLQSLI